MCINVANSKYPISFNHLFLSHFFSVPKNSLIHATFLIDDLLAIYYIHESVIQ